MWKQYMILEEISTVLILFFDERTWGINVLELSLSNVINNLCILLKEKEKLLPWPAYSFRMSNVCNEYFQAASWSVCNSQWWRCLTFKYHICSHKWRWFVSLYCNKQSRISGALWTTERPRAAIYQANGKESNCRRRNACSYLSCGWISHRSNSMGTRWVYLTANN